MKILAKIFVTILLVSLLATSARADRNTICYYYVDSEPIWGGQPVWIVGDEPFAIGYWGWEPLFLGWTQGYYVYYQCP